ncbi:MAG: toprim domain-containing protein [bacterium]|nr:toprim domain-containing protein [bacterium]
MDVQQYLSTRNIKFKECTGNELVMRCPFNDCDVKVRHAGHFYINTAKQVYSCQKCKTSGHISQLIQHLGDDPYKLGLIEHTQGRAATVQHEQKNAASSQISKDQIVTWHNNLPDHIRQYLKDDRGLSDLVIGDAKLGWDGSHITIPIADESGAWLYARRRAAPGSNDEPRYKTPKGAQAALYGVHLLKGAISVVICEGELDALVLLSNGILAVSGTAGAGTFKQEWAQLLSNVPEVHIVYDHDAQGRAGALMVGKLIPHAKICELPGDVGEKGDVTDFFARLKRTPDDFGEILTAGKTLAQLEESELRYADVPPPQRTMTIEAWREALSSRFPEFLTVSEICMSVLAQLLIKDIRNPFGLVLIDVPSAGKTITLNFFADLQGISYASDSFTPSSLVSHASNVKREQLEEIDLLPRIRFKMFVVRDLAPIFAERQETLVKNLGVMTRVFDGEGLETDSGIHGKRGYRGNFVFMFLAGSTPIQPRVFKTMGNLGSRLFFVNMHSPDKSEDALAEQLAKPSYKLKEQECRDATCDFALNLWKHHSGGVAWDNEGDPVHLRRIIARCARLLARLRGTISVWSNDESDEQHYTNVVIEKPDRISTCLYNLVRGHALISGRTQIAEADLWVAIDVALQSAQLNRVRLLGAILEHGGTVSTEIVMDAINCSNPTALKEIETLHVLGIVNTEDQKTNNDAGRPMRIVTIKKEFEWFCSDEYGELRARGHRASFA